MVTAGATLAAFDRSNELKLLREAQTKFDDLRASDRRKEGGTQKQRRKAHSDLQQAQADLKKGRDRNPQRSGAERDRAGEERGEAGGRARACGQPERSNRFHDVAEAAELRVLELQRDRQKIAVQRQTTECGKAAGAGRQSRAWWRSQNVYRNNSLGHAQEGDQFWPGSPLLQLFDPSAMVVEVSVGEPDGAVLVRAQRRSCTWMRFPD